MTQPLQDVIYRFDTIADLEAWSPGNSESIDGALVYVAGGASKHDGDGRLYRIDARSALWSSVSPNGNPLLTSGQRLTNKNAAGFPIVELLNGAIAVPTHRVAQTDIAAAAVSPDKLPASFAHLACGLAASTRQAGSVHALAQIVGSTAFSNALLTANQLVLRPFMLPATVTPAALGVSVVTGVASATSHIAIYADNNGVPGERLWVSASMATATSATHRVDATANMPTLEGGRTYWAGVASTHGVTLRGVTVTSLQPIGLVSAMNVNTPIVGLSASAITPSAPPNPWVSATAHTAVLPLIYIVYP